MDLEEEVSDTRLAPGEVAQLNYDVPFHPMAATLVLRVRVLPDEFYARFYRAVLEGNLADKGKREIQLALKSAESVEFTLYVSRHHLR